MRRTRPHLLDDPVQRRVYARALRMIGGQLLIYDDGRTRYIAPNMRGTTVPAGTDPTRALKRLGVRL